MGGTCTHRCDCTCVCYLPSLLSRKVCKAAILIVDVLPGRSFYALVANGFNTPVHLWKRQILVFAFSTPRFILYSTLNEFYSYPSPTSNVWGNDFEVGYHQPRLEPYVDCPEQVRRYQAVNFIDKVEEKRHWKSFVNFGEVSYLSNKASWLSDRISKYVVRASWTSVLC